MPVRVKRKEKTMQAVDKHSLHELRRSYYFGTEYSTTSPA
jgi:hypothetical protein